MQHQQAKKESFEKTPVYNLDEEAGGQQGETYIHDLTRTTIKKNTFWKYVMHLPAIPETSFVIRPDQPLPPRIIDEQYDKIWNDQCLRKMEENTTREEEEVIRNGIPTEVMGKVATESMRWEKIIQGGMCSASYANDKYILQLTNSTIVAVLLSGFATVGLVQPPDFSQPEVYPSYSTEIFQSGYSLCMLASGLYCFAATGIALHSVNRISNVLPSKSSVAYMTLNVFYMARDAVADYVFKGMACACGGIIAAFIWHNQSIFYGIPAAAICTLGCSWFIASYSKWQQMTTFHSDVADKLCAKDIVLAAKSGTSITEGLWES